MSVLGSIHSFFLATNTYQSSVSSRCDLDPGSSTAIEASLRNLRALYFQMEDKHVPNQYNDLYSKTL